MDSHSSPVTNDPQRHRFEVHVDGVLATLTYRERGDRITLVHTEVPEELGGRGIGGMLAAAALNYARENGLRVTPTCPFVAAYIRRHPEFADLVDPVPETPA